MNKLAVIFLVFGLAGCASYPSAESLATSGNWQQLGLQDGQRGYPERQRVGLTDLNPLDKQSEQQYRLGYSLGLDEFCTVENAFFRGLSGQFYMNQCEGRSNADEIIASWEDGLTEYEREQWDSHNDYE